MLFREALPNFYVEVEGLLRAIGRDDLIQQLPILELVRRCPCGQSDCATFYLSGGRQLNVVEKNIVGVRLGESFDLDADRGMVVIDVDNYGRICGIEILNRDDVYESLKLLGDGAWAGIQD
jgi:uncharacterized protein YuzE